MLKNAIAPIQAWLMSQGRCVGCGRDLKDGKIEKKNSSSNKVICKCGRIFIQDLSTKKFRRALLEEV